ncbi:MAG: sialate O-acetylesterase [Planctomycetes bacterium]|nr:sialate O-acetylesterase [Planctomycetota bacterium]
MKTRTVTISLLAAACVLGLTDDARGGETLRVFLLAGQSNAEGADTHASQVDTFPPFIGAGAPQSDVLFWYETSSEPLTSGDWIALQPELQRQILGPELTFARKVKGSSSGPIAIIKSTQGGTNLAVDWDPDNPAGAQLYERTMTLMQTALTDLTNDGIAWTLEGVLWHQGENDMLNNEYVAQYGARLTNLIARFRADLAVPDLKWFVGATSDKCIWGMDFRDNMQILRSQQLAAAAADPLVHFVATSHLAFKINIGQLQPDYHFGTEGQLQLGEAYADAYLSTIGVDVTHQSQEFCCGFPGEPGGDVRVFVFAGQRSMEGEGAHVAHIGNYPEFAALSTPQEDVLYRYRLGGGNHTSTGWAPLGPADYLGNFGPELSFGQVVASQLDDTVAVIKVTHSAAVARDWLPAPTDASLPQYDDSIAFIQTALGNLQLHGFNPVLEALVWVPGEHDAWWTPFRVEYATNLQTVVNQMRVDLGAPNLRCLVAELADDLVWETSRLNELDAQIQTVAASDPLLWFVGSTGIPVPPLSPTFGTEGTLLLGEHLAEFYLALVCPADLDGSGDVGFGDILQIIAAWGPCPGCPEDLSGNGIADFADILAVIGAWGPCP